MPRLWYTNGVKRPFRSIACAYTFNASSYFSGGFELAGFHRQLHIPSFNHFRCVLLGTSAARALLSETRRAKKQENGTNEQVCFPHVRYFFFSFCNASFAVCA